MKILLTGSNGMLAYDLAQTLKNNDFEVLQYNKNELDITDYSTSNKVISSIKPDIIVNCAAYTNVDEAQKDISKAREVNANGAKNLAKIASSLDLILIYISSDYIFDGKKNSPYLTTDTPNPTNNYGLTKLEGEKYVQKYLKKFYIIRTCWLFGKNGKNFVDSIINLKNEKEINVVNDQTGCPTSTLALSRGIVEIIKNKKEYGIYNVCSKNGTTRFELAKKILKYFNSKTLVKPVNSDFFKGAIRPKYSILKTDIDIGTFESQLEEYFKLFY